ncbi:MAG: hypothetical protein M3Y41_01815, partial [Pseudomonadota bacterium]|nr:hypothetical protein [Pseudomonadota bacterium]
MAAQKGIVLSTLTIRDLDDATLARLHARADAQGRSAADEARRILEDSLTGPAADAMPEETLADAMRAIFVPLGGHEFPFVREPGNRPPPDFSGPEWD